MLSFPSHLFFGMKSMAYHLRESYCWWLRNPKANHPGMSKNLANSGINKLSTIIGVGFLPSTVVNPGILVVHWLFCQDHSLQANVVLPIPHFSGFVSTHTHGRVQWVVQVWLFVEKHEECMNIHLDFGRPDLIGTPGMNQQMFPLTWPESLKS